MALRLFSSLLSAFFAALILGVFAPAPARAHQGTGAEYRLTAPKPLHPNWDPACYLDNEGMQSFLQNTASSYPNLATMLDAGLSWEGTRHIGFLKLTNSASPGPKPNLFLLAGQRPRDIAGPELLRRFISYLTQQYGIDPDVTFLLDNRQLLILPISNPDGYFQVYSMLCPL